jgi:hypothetical protein
VTPSTSPRTAPPRWCHPTAAKSAVRLPGGAIAVVEEIVTWVLYEYEVMNVTMPNGTKRLVAVPIAAESYGTLETLTPILQRRNAVWYKEFRSKPDFDRQAVLNNRIFRLKRTPCPITPFNMLEWVGGVIYNPPR